MNRRLSLHLLLAEDIREEITALCRRANSDLKLSERFLDYPLHISLKRSFETADPELIAEALKQELEIPPFIYCGRAQPLIAGKKLWLVPQQTEELLQIHQRIDEYLKEHYAIEIDGFDRNYQPHITLFHSSDEERLGLMAEYLKKTAADIVIRTAELAYVTGDK